MDNMIRTVEMPHLPKGRVRHIIIGEKYRNLLEKALSVHDLEAIWLKNNNFVDERLSGHTDLSAVQIGDRIVLAEYLKPCEQIHNFINADYVPNPQKPIYPYDAGLNFCIIGDRLFYSPKTANAEQIRKVGCKEKIVVKQGYTKCSICVVDENSIITADKMISVAAKESGMNVLYISKPFVSLKGFDCGFIGGAAFKISANELAFTGEIKDAGIRTEIECFLNERNVRPIYLTNNLVFDIGSAIPLTEQIP